MEQKENTNTNAVEVMESSVTATQPVATTEDLEYAIKTAEKTMELVKKIKILAIKQTNKHDWVDMQGKPYLQSSGAEKIARLFGISWKICEGYPKREDKQDEKGSYYIYAYKGEFTMGGKSIEVIGTCSQRDKFFGKDKNTETGFKNAADVDITNIMKKANTNMINRGITTLLGIRNLTWEEVENGGVEQQKTAKVTYAQGGAGGGKISPAQANRLYAIAKQNNVSNETMSKYLKTNFKIDNSKEINKTDYERICKWVEEQGKGSAIEPEEDNIEL